MGYEIFLKLLPSPILWMQVVIFNIETYFFWFPGQGRYPPAKDLLHGGQHSSCVHAGGLSCMQNCSYWTGPGYTQRQGLELGNLAMGSIPILPVPFLVLYSVNVPLVGTHKEQIQHRMDRPILINKEWDGTYKMCIVWMGYAIFLTGPDNGTAASLHGSGLFQR